MPNRHRTFGGDPRCDIPLTAGYGLTALHFEIAPGAADVSFLCDSSGGTANSLTSNELSAAALLAPDHGKIKVTATAADAAAGRQGTPERPHRPPDRKTAGSGHGIFRFLSIFRVLQGYRG